MTQCNGHNCGCSQNTGNCDINDSTNKNSIISNGQKHNNGQNDAIRIPAQVEGKKMHTDHFRIFGLDCADCAAKLEKRVGGMDGVARAQVNFGASKLTVYHNTSISKINRTVQELGYQVQSWDSPGNTQQGLLRQDKKAILTLFSGVFLIAGFISSMLGTADNITTALLAAAMLIGGFNFAKSAFYSIKAVSLDMNVLMSVAAIGAAAIGEWSEGATAVFLFSLGNTLQAYSMDKTRNSIRKLMDLSPQQAIVKRNGEEITLPVQNVRIDDIMVVRPGEKIALDGVVVNGISTIDQSPITGESMPVEKLPGHEVFAGTFNHEGSLEIKVTKLVEDTTLARIVNMVEEAQAQRAPSQQFVDVFARYYTPAVIAVALSVTIVPTLLLGQPFKPWLEKALILLVIACPCALVISTPVAIVTAIGSAAKRGVLIKGGAYLERAGQIKVIAFDKTGTLTTGRPEVTDIIPMTGYTDHQVLGIAAAVEQRSQHPVGRAVTRQAENMGVAVATADEFMSFTGKGVKGLIDGQNYYVGNTRMFQEMKIDLADISPTLNKLQAQGKTTMLVGDGQRILGIIAVADKVKYGSSAVMRQLKEAGIQRTIMLTGDSAPTARAVSQLLDLDDYRPELLPGDKLKLIQENKQKFGRVAMVGDGVNDAPALAAADIGIAMGGAGTDTALETADIVLMADDLQQLPYAVELSRRTLGIIKQNITFSLAIKALFIIGTFFGVTNLWMAVFADTGASMIVIANGLRLMLTPKGKKHIRHVRKNNKELYSET